MHWEPLQCLFYEQFRFRARDQYGRRDLERKSKKFPFTDDIGNRLAVFSALNVVAKLIFLRVGQDSFGMCGEMGTGGAQCALEQDARIHLVDLPVREFHRIGSFNRSMDSRLRGNDINMRR